MNTQNTSSHPLGYWLTAVDRLMAAEFARAFESEGATRRDWRLLNVVDGTAPARRPLHARKLEGLIARGWVAQDDSGWTLTDEGRAAKERLGALVDGIRATMTDAVSPEDFATTLASLEKMAVALGWDENTPLPRRARREGFGSRRRSGRGRGRGFGPGFGPRFGPDFRRAVAWHLGFGPHSGHAGHTAEHEHDRGHGHEHEHEHDHGHRHARHGHGHPHHGDSHHGDSHHGRHGGHRAEHTAQHAYERGFDAGYARGRDA